MKCAMCKEKTDWDSSFGKESFIVCPECHKKIASLIERNKDKFSSNVIATEIILAIGFTREGIEIK